MTEAPHPLIAYCNARKSGSRSVRDAAHEAFHALTVGEKKNWSREHIHRKLLRKFGKGNGARLWLHELKARAVEQLVCKKLEVEIDDLDHWVMMSCIEAIKNGLPQGDPDQSVKYAKDFLQAKDVIEAAEGVLALIA
jgi:hypothetical protein